MNTFVGVVGLTTLVIVAGAIALSLAQNLVILVGDLFTIIH